MSHVDMNENQTRVLQLLRDLGGTKEEVAATLGEQGITGIPDDPCLCPIVNYLEQNDIAVTSVSSMEIRAWGELLLVSDEVPEPVAEFINEFDAYPWDFRDLVNQQWLEEHPA